jgi:hypothetical protein
MRLVATALALLLTFPALASTPGSFRGKVIEFPTGKGSASGLIFVMGRNGALRRVQVGSARVSYDQHIPTKFRHKQPNESLKHGTDIRVEAEENGHGTWRARTIQILGVPGAPAPEPRAQAKPKLPQTDRPATGPVLSKRG